MLTSDRRERADKRGRSRSVLKAEAKPKRAD
jgi:hypothetical protein